MGLCAVRCWVVFRLIVASDGDGVFEMADGGRGVVGVADNFNNIKAVDHLRVAVFRDKRAGSATEGTSLGGIDGTGGTGEIFAGAGLHLDENYNIPL